MWDASVVRKDFSAAARSFNGTVCFLLHIMQINSKQEKFNVVRTFKN